jgi:hypothetical protein
MVSSVAINLIYAIKGDGSQAFIEKGMSSILIVAAVVF